MYITNPLSKVATPIIAIGYFTNNVTVLKGVTIGRDSLISAMTLIRKDIPEKSLVAGIPGKVLKDNACWSREYIHDYEKQFWK